MSVISGLSRGFSTCCLRFKNGVATTHAKLASGWLARLYREGVEPSGSQQKVSDHTFIPLSWTYPGAREVSLRLIACLWPARANSGDKSSPFPHLCVPVHQLLGLLNRFPVVFADKDLSRPRKAAGIQWVNAILGHHSPDAAIATSTAEMGTTLVRFIPRPGARQFCVEHKANLPRCHSPRPAAVFPPSPPSPPPFPPLPPPPQCRADSRKTEQCGAM